MVRKNLKKTIIDNSITIQKSNDLSMAKLSHGLTLNQMQLLAYAILCTQKSGITEFRKHEFEKMFNIDTYRTDTAKSDSSKVLAIQFAFEDIESDSFEFLNVFRKMKYDKGLFTFVWDQDITKHILDLKDKYVLTDLSITSQFKSSFTWTLYDYLRGSYGCWYKSFTKEGLMKLFSVENYKSYQDNTGLFKNKVLDVAINEINTFTELDVKYEEVKEGRAIIGFKILWSSGTTVRKASDKQIEILTTLIDILFTDMMIYMKIKEEKNRDRAYEIVKEAQSIRINYLEDETGLTNDLCKKLTNKAEDYLNEINKILEVEYIPKLQQPQVPLYNWLND